MSRGRSGGSGRTEHHRDAQSVLFFNDSIFAIAMTLLAVEIVVPAGTNVRTLGHALRSLGPAFASYGISFLVIGLYWLGHHRQIQHFDHFDGAALAIDLLFLMSVAFIPFPSVLFNRYFGTVSVVFYAASLATTGILLGTLWVYAMRRGLLRDADKQLRTYYTLRALFPPVIFLLSIPIAIASPYVTPYTWLLIFMGRPFLRRLAYR